MRYGGWGKVGSQHEDLRHEDRRTPVVGSGEHAPVINLQDDFGDRYRVTYEESYFVERSRQTVVDPWLMIIPCRFGHIFPHGDDILAASVDGFPKIAGRLRRLAGVHIHQDGDFGELTVLFPVGTFDTVAEIMRPRRRRQLTDQQRAELAERGRRALAGFREANVQSELAAEFGNVGVYADPEAVQAT